MVDQITMLRIRSPSEAWHHIFKFYQTPPTTDEARLEVEWNSLEMLVGEIPLVYFSRATLIRHYRARHGIFMRDADDNIHYYTYVVCRLTMRFKRVCCWGMDFTCCGYILAVSEWPVEVSADREPYIMLYSFTNILTLAHTGQYPARRQNK